MCADLAITAGQGTQVACEPPHLREKTVIGPRREAASTRAEAANVSPRKESLRFGFRILRVFRACFVRQMQVQVLEEGNVARRRSWKKRLLVVVLGVVLVALVAGAAAIYAYDRSHDDRLARGVTVDGIDVGGLQLADARAKLARRLLPRYDRALVFTHGDRKFVLRPQKVGLRVDIESALQTALAQTRRGNLLSRVYRIARGERLDLSLTVGTRYSPAQVAAFVDRMRRAVAEKPTPAEFVASLTQPQILPSTNGTALRAPVLAAEVRARLRDPSASRRLLLPVRPVVPDPSTADLARQYSTFLAVSRGERRLRLFKGLKLVKTYLIAVGRQGLETPAGVYEINDKQIDPSWHVPNSPWAGALAGRIIPPGPDDPLKARWMGFYNGAGIHGTDAVYSLGTAASHGCIRMAIPDVIELYPLVPLHTPIYIS
jgi:lipoprotein-anchoring transpeptidase ErfK/SrfK